MLGARERGVNFLLSVFCLVWVADSAAYLGGRLLGRRKLAVTISPGKTWEGAFSGVLAVALLALGWTAWVDTAPWVDGPSFFGTIRAQWGLLGMWTAAACLTALAVVGDLFESLLKRSVGVKDSSGLLPGHGGVLDRIDALIPVFPAALALCALKEWGP
jgi:phosphatidate cytidylyltransferase